MPYAASLLVITDTPAASARAAVPPPTALLWIKMLADRGLFVRGADPTDGRRVFIDLSDAAGSLRAYLAEIRS